MKPIYSSEDLEPMTWYGCFWYFVGACVFSAGVLGCIEWLR
ncbi:MAG: hypothetical protein AAF266_14805 [Planctomycetota bacterium]